MRLKLVVQTEGGSLISWGEGASLALVDHPFSDGITIKNTLYLEFVKTESETLVENDLRR